MVKPFITVMCLWFKALSISFAVRFSRRALHERFTHSTVSVSCEHMCAFVCFFFISMWKLWCWVSLLSERGPIGWKVCQRFLSLLFSSPFFSTLRFTRPSLTCSKRLPDTPLSEVRALQLLSHLTDCVCVFESKHLCLRDRSLLYGTVLCKKSKQLLYYSTILYSPTLLFYILIILFCCSIYCTILCL